ncbi:prepilin-type N-terminal cleavage/methylation domain-containing protein, partial [bacterium]|nr:prepilin-type N-terminal cleavage/methylation domain-containing protein [bacterium]
MHVRNFVYSGDDENNEKVYLALGNGRMLTFMKRGYVMFQTYFSTQRMLHKETQGESRVRENRTHGLVYEVKAWLLNRASFTLIELLVVIAI